ncbi:hypothetical protein LMG31886_21110 [Xanthomonas hydrangeae]|nr:hypothetical protein LMG31884_21500 [Xanthomonas hydrangeae]CAD7716425.1 hypothetical protein LMG31884_21500 [Xanthomonas hydrangeae]CAD7731614.1 hypothetical protein LMG31887_21490 [Xanthomonas hydrangeae]CAD7731617.1 hypothetical protein LMG31887_21490 [Xanthomonas hydrangeae]CAD7734612.1 hypothetical protein LMG31886_21110 [Xanthomonas hydrangeae]
MIIPSRLLRLSLGVSVCVASTSVAAQAIAPETTASSATEAGAQQQDPAPIASFEQWLADFRQRALAAGIETSTLDNAFAGVTPDPSVQALAQQQASVLLPTGYRGPAFLVFDNFRSILRYNNSTAYALAVGLLADGYAGEAGVEQPWPQDDPPLNSTAQIT